MIHIPYGKTQLTLPDLWNGQAQVIEPGPFPSTGVGEAEVRRALDEPVGSEALREVARGSGTVAVVVPDLTRRAAVSAYLPAVMGELEAAGISGGAITIVVALVMDFLLLPPLILYFEQRRRLWTNRQ